jgi:hypothetical protein
LKRLIHRNLKQATQASLVLLGLILAQSAFAQSIIKVDGKYGLVDEFGITLVESNCDFIEQPLPGAQVFILSKGGKQAYYLFPNLQQDPEWHSSEFIYDEITVPHPRTTRPSSYHYLLLKSDQGSRYVAMFVEYQLTTGAVANREVGGIKGVFEPELLYDKLYRSRNFDGYTGDLVLVKDGKYGMHVYGYRALEPIFDLPLTYIYQTDYIEVWKDGLMGVVHDGKLAIPTKFKKGELVYGGDNFTVQVPGEPIQFFSITHSVAITVNTQGKPLLALDSTYYVFDKAFVYGDTAPVVLGYSNLKMASRYKYIEGTRAYALSNRLTSILIIDPITGIAVREYNEKGCFYHLGRAANQNYDSRFVFKYEPDKASSDRVNVTIFDILEDKVLHQYTLKKVTSEYIFTYLHAVDKKYYEIVGNRKKWLSKEHRNVGYFDFDTLQFHRRKRAFK